MQPIVQVEDVHKSFDKTPILKGVSFKIEEGDLVSLIGPSGCGKSTLLRCLNGLEVLDSGRVEICGVAMERKPSTPAGPLADVAHKLRRNVGMVFQSFNLFPHKTLIENIMLAPMVVKGIARDEAAGLAEKLLKKVVLGSWPNASDKDRFAERQAFFDAVSKAVSSAPLG